MKPRFFADVKFGEVERQIGSNESVFLIAELGANHDSNLQQALVLVDLAAEAGFDAVKLQTYTADSLTLSHSRSKNVLNPIWGSDNLYDLYSSAAMPMEFHRPLFERIQSHGMVPLTTIYDPVDLEFAESLDCPVYKVSSFEINHFELLEALAATKKPLIVSTGATELPEIEESLEHLRKNQSGPIMLMQCSSVYPAPPNASNLLAIGFMREQFGVPVGFSDHTEGFAVTIGAVGAGATAIEKHFTNDRSRQGPDHRFSIEFSEAKVMVSAIREVEKALGDGRKKVEEPELENRVLGKRSIYVTRDVSEGEELSGDTLRVVRPGDGIHPRHLGRARSARATRDIPAGSPLQNEDFT